jgi:hypothetical protein
MYCGPHGTHFDKSVHHQPTKCAKIFIQQQPNQFFLYGVRHIKDLYCEKMYGRKLCSSTIVQKEMTVGGGPLLKKMSGTPLDKQYKKIFL